VHQLAGRVVDRGDVIGIERVTQTERVREPGHANAEPPVVRREHEQEKDAETDHVQRRDRHEHQRSTPTLTRCQRFRDGNQVPKDPEPCPLRRPPRAH
jgi:hypothetical protein